MTMLAPTPVVQPVRYEFETVTVQRAAHTLAGTLRDVVGHALAIVVLVLIAAQFLVTPVLQSRSQVVAGRDLAARFDTALGAVGMADLSPLPNEPVAAGTAVALLRVPALGLSQVVLEGASGAQLQHGPGHMTGTSGVGEPGVSLIAARRATWGSPFAHLPRLKVGDVITTTTVAGTMDYRVTKVTTAAPDFQAQTGSTARLVLQTSTPAGLAFGDVFVIADSTRAAFPETPQGRLPDAGARQSDFRAVPVALMWVALMVLFVGLAYYWVRARIMERALAWTLVAPIIVLAGLLALRAFASALPPTL